MKKENQNFFEEMENSQSISTGGKVSVNIQSGGSKQNGGSKQDGTNKQNGGNIQEEDGSKTSVLKSTVGQPVKLSMLDNQDVDSDETLTEEGPKERRLLREEDHDAEVGEYGEKKKRKVPPPLADWNRSQSFPPGHGELQKQTRKISLSIIFDQVTKMITWLKLKFSHPIYLCNQTLAIFDQTEIRIS